MLLSEFWSKTVNYENNLHCVSFFWQIIKISPKNSGVTPHNAGFVTHSLRTLPHWVRVSLNILYWIIYIQFYCDIKTATAILGTLWMNLLRTAWEILDLPLLNISLYSNLPLPHSVPYPKGLNRPFLYMFPLDCTFQGVYVRSQHKASEASFDFTSQAAYHGYHRFGLFSYVCKKHAGCNG